MDNLDKTVGNSAKILSVKDIDRLATKLQSSKNASSINSVEFYDFLLKINLVLNRM
ncbi:MAG: hypothetical protein F6K55_03170 [Moorea sp. SIO4A3]|nr:hypothetical protein [Moorena sp. SIO4A3]